MKKSERTINHKLWPGNINTDVKALFDLPGTTGVLSFFKLQICGIFFPPCFLGKKMHICLKNHVDRSCNLFY